MTRENEGRFKKVILHVGSDKTGSTSLQLFLDKSRDLLLRNSVLYPPYQSGTSHKIFGSCFVSEADLLSYNDHQDELQAILDRNRDYLCLLEKLFRETDAEILLISYEGLSHLDAASFVKMKVFLEKYCDEFEIVLYVRPPLSYAASSLSQRVKLGRRICGDDEATIPCLNHQGILETIGGVFKKSQINVRLFSRETFPGGNVVLDFLSLLNLPKHVEEKVISKVRNRNFSLSQEALEIGDRMVELLDGYIPPNEFNRKRLIGSVYLPAIKGQKFQLTDLQQEAILKRSAPHIEYLSKEFDMVMPEEIFPVYKPLRISQATIDFTAKALLRILAPDFRPPTEGFSRNKGKLNKYFIFKVILKIRMLKTVKMIWTVNSPIYRSLKRVHRRFKEAAHYKAPL